MKTIFITAQLGQEIRDFLVGEFRRLAIKQGNIRLVYFVLPDKLEKCREAFSHERCIIEPFPTFNFSRAKIFFRVLSWAMIPTETAYIRHHYVYLRGGSYLSFIIKRIVWLLGHTKFGRGLARWSEFHLFYDDYPWKDYFDTYKPDVVFAPGGFRDADFTMLKYAKRKHIPTVGMMRSWDNMSSKGFLRVHPDLFLAQNATMPEEAVYWNDFPRAKIRITGFPTFDLYRDPSWVMTKEEIAKIIGADPKKRWIIYCDGPLFTGILMCKDTGEHIRMLQRAVDRGEFGDAQIIARLHPANRSGLQYREFKDCIVLNLVKDWGFTEESMKYLYNVMRWGDVSTNFGSTITLDAAIADKPIILMGFNGAHDAEVPWDQKLSQAFDHTTHINYLLRTGGVWRVANEQELVQVIKTYLKNPALHHEGRARIVDEIAGPVDGGAGRRVLEALLGMIDQSKELLPQTNPFSIYKKIRRRGYQYMRRAFAPSLGNVEDA